MLNNRKKTTKKKVVPPAVMRAKLERYFQVYLKKGYSIKGLSHFLKEEGYSYSLIDEVAEEYKSYAVARKRTMTYTMIGLAIFIILVPGIYFAMQAPGDFITGSVIDCGFDKACLVAYADKCEDAVYHQDTDGTLVRYETEGCSLKVSFEKFSETEPVEVTTFLGGKEMQCAYEKREFDSSWPDSFLAPVDHCDGELKESLFVLRLAQARLAR